MLKPRKQVPSLEFSLVNGQTWSLSNQKPENFTMVVVYRGLHCPICHSYLRELDRNIEAFKSHGVNVAVVSTDPKDRAEKAQTDWGLENFSIGYGLSIEKAREWGLYISTSRGKTSADVVEPDLFAEPGLFLIRPDGTLYGANYITMPFARPHFKDILGALDFIIPNDYPARGEA